MCGILGLFGLKGNPKFVMTLAKALQQKQKHRGPDSSGCIVSVRKYLMILIFQEHEGVFNILCHERLIINDFSEAGYQPITDPNNPDIVYIVNGEIYNYPQVKALHSMINN